MIPPPEGTRERWAWDFVACGTPADKLGVSPLPASWEEGATGRDPRPGRDGFTVTPKRDKTPRALARPEERARLLHVFLHHEVQAAELFAWAVLAFPEAPGAFRAGLLGILREELEHARMYQSELERLGSGYGAFPVRDWFWERVPRCASPAAFVATLGIGFEGGNLDHAQRFAGMLRRAGDERAAEVVEQVGRDEEGHVRFAVEWLKRFSGEGLDFVRWRAELPKPVGPILMRGEPINEEARARAGMPAAFVEALRRAT